MSAHVRDLERLRRQLGADRLHLAAHSMGTYPALAYLREHPRRTSGMALLAPVSPRGVYSVGDSADFQKRMARLKKWARRPACRREMREAGVDRPDSLLPDEQASARWRIQFTCVNAYHVGRWRAMEGGMAFYDSDAGQAASASMADRFDFTADLREHSRPVRVLAGDHDWVGGGPWVADRYREISGVRARLLEDAGHSLWLDAPERFERWLDAALAATAASP